MQSAPSSVDVAPGNCGYQPRFVAVDGIRTRYYEVGQGEPMLLCHGMGWAACFGADTWAPVLGGLGERFHVFAPDKLASGMTDNPPDPADYTIQAQVAHMAGFLRTLGLERVHLVGQSRGAYLAARLALEQPGLARSLVLVDSQTIAPEVGAFSREAFDARRRVLFAGRPDDLREAFRFTQAKLSYSPAHISDEFIEIAAYMEALPKARETLRCWQQGGEARFEASLDQQKVETLRWLAEGRLQVPTLVTWGRDDPSAILAQGVALFDLLCERNAQTRMWIFNQAGHFPYREHPAEWVRIVTAFVAASPGTPAQVDHQLQRAEGT